MELHDHSKKPLNVVILAAGLGTRMKSRQVKVLHKLGGRPLIAHVCRTAATLKPHKIYVVVGHQAGEVQKAAAEVLSNDEGVFVTQAEQHGTGDAVMAARSELHEANSTVLILSGDVPAVRVETLQALISKHKTENASCTILSVRLENPTGYGRIMRDEVGGFLKILAQRDATDEQSQIREVNAGIYCFEAQQLFAALERVQPANSQGEYYLTDVPEILRSENQKVAVYHHHDAREVLGVN